MTILADPKLEALLQDLHSESDRQGAAFRDYIAKRGGDPQAAPRKIDPDASAFLRDKMFAIAPGKGRFCYGLCRSLNARRIVEVGTSFGVSTLYLAAALRDNGGGTVTATEWEPSKAAAAKENWAKAQLESFIDLRVGDLRETLKSLEGPIDFVLMDVWLGIARPAIELIAPHLRSGAIVVADNTAAYRQGYASYFEFIADPENRLRTMTLPFAGGLEMTVRV